MTSRCERLHRIETGFDKPPGQAGSADEVLPFLLRRAIAVRGRDPVEYQRLVDAILSAESYAVKQKVALAGLNRDGRAWVPAEDVEDVASTALTRLSRFIGRMTGSSKGELRAGVNTCVKYAVGDYIRKDQRNDSIPVDPGHFTGALSPEQQQFAELAGLASRSSAEDRALFKQKLELLDELVPRAAQVMVLRGQGLPATEIAERLGINPANVDQIYSRSSRKLNGMA